ncbi:OLC1v1003108C1 [Oldenlandia corymbosa var. corymbosa]|uniref:OLC1v1003108C1 n=1 Tax=Oldenlandia corymbosa var. corymbosa TaxID=529605 RepID=A0AAV1D9A7_OLDCO|nr:OLC1v1003108C1 [Oldenlandia corymbosa var. corymbosa]
MGNCVFHGFGSVTTLTAKLILVDGQLQEFRSLVRVSELVKRNPDCFICNSDEMEFDGLVSAMEDEESLLPGQLYFELPLIFLKQRLQPEDMASLAVKASLALSTRKYDQNGCYCRSPGKRLSFLDDDDDDPIVFLHHEGNVRVSSPISTGPANYCDLMFVKSRRTPAAGKGKIKVTKFTASLSAILEIDE